MTTVNVDTTLTVRHAEVDLSVEATLIEGGSDRFGSDEPSWIEIEGKVWRCSHTGKEVSKRLCRLLDEHYSAYVNELLIESR